MEAKMKQQLDALFYPERVAIIGSVKKGKIANQIITQLREGDYPGTIYAINPKAERPEGFPDIGGYPTVKDVSEAIDLAVICAPAAHTAAVLTDCGEKKVPTAVVITSGFSEAGNKDGEEELKTIAGKYGVRLVGPNCAGIMNSTSRFFASIEVRALPGQVAFITQSGAVGGAVLAMAETRGIGFSKFASCGNRADIGEIEFLEYLEEDPETSAIALYVESMQDGKAFIETAGRIAKKKPLMIIKAGRSSSGVRATSSHTGSMAGSEAVFQAMVKQTGVIRVDGIEEMLDLCSGFSHLPPLDGRKVAIVTNSGGPSILTADKAEEKGLVVAEPEDSVKKELYEFLPAHCSVRNPFDLTVEGTDENYRKTIELLLSKGYDSAIAINVATPFLDSRGLAQGIIDASKKQNKPVAAVFMADRIVETGIELLRSEKLQDFPTGERAAAVLAEMVSFRETATGKSASPLISGGSTSGAGITEKSLPLSKPILEPEAVKFLEEEGFPFPAHAYVTNRNEIAETCKTLPNPLVMKVVSPKIIHKSDEEGVVLNLNTEEEVAKAFTEMESRLKDRDFRGVMLYEQMPKAMEVIAGVNQDPDFGAVIAVGAGGVYTELLKDISLRIAPFSKETAQAMLEELKTYKLLTGFRGSPVLDTEKLKELIVKLSELAVTYPEIAELDLNPLFVMEDRVLVGDVRILTGQV